MQMLEMTVELSRDDDTYERMFGRWIWDGWLVANALEKGADRVSFWNENTHFYHDVIELPDGATTSLEVYSMQAVVPLFACVSIPMTAHHAIEQIRTQLQRLRAAYEEPPSAVNLSLPQGDGTHFMAAIVGLDRLQQVLGRLLDPAQFLSDHGLRSLSLVHRDHPYSYAVNGTDYQVAYWPAESHDRTFGGNSNWRGPVWMPMNFLAVQAVDAYARFFGDTVTVEFPVGSGHQATLRQVGDGLADRLAALFVRGADGRRPVLGSNDYFQDDPHWRDLVPFYEYFDGDDGHGVGASHQTGWTALVALLLQFRGRLRFDVAAS